MKQIGVLCLTFSLLVFPARAQNQHEVDPGETNFGAVSLESFNRRIDDSAADFLKQYKPGAVSRIILFDSAFPIDVAEYKASGGYGVMLVSAFSHDNAELPIANVYIGGTKLKFLGGISRQVQPTSLPAAAFGTFRTDSFWLVPANLYRPALPITADFAKNRNGFAVGNAPPLPAFMRYLPTPGPSGEANAATLKKLVAREYPGFGIDISP